MIVWIHTRAKVIDIVQVVRSNFRRYISQRGATCFARVCPPALKFLTSQVHGVAHTMLLLKFETLIAVLSPVHYINASHSDWTGSTAGIAPPGTPEGHIL